MNNIEEIYEIQSKPEASGGIEKYEDFDKCLQLSFRNYKGEYLSKETIEPIIIRSDLYIEPSYCPVTYCAHMFRDCINLKEMLWKPQPTDNFLIDAQYMFSGCANITRIDLTWMNFNISKSINLTSMFANCTKLEYVDLRTFPLDKTSNLTITNMFQKVPINCKVIVKNEACKNKLVSTFGLTNVDIIPDN